MQISIFDGEKKLKLTKPIRLIELFGGIGSQAMALRNIGAKFESYKLCEFDKYAITSYNAIHGTNFETSDITKIHASDLGIVDIDKYDYILTYSFPCQDLSLAGKRNGMDKNSGTRSGLLWEVERLLNECEQLPQVILMENVPQVHGTNNKDNFKKWCEFLESKGYKNYWQDLNAKQYGVTQNRDRCFMVSVLGDYFYEFPTPVKLEKRLNDYLENEVDEKYYLSETMVKFFIEDTAKQSANGNGFKFSPSDGNNVAKTITTRAGGRMDDNFIETKCIIAGNLDIKGRLESACRVHSVDGIAPTCNTCGGSGLETKILEPRIIKEAYGYYTNTTKEFARSPIKDLSRTIKAEQYDAGVVRYNGGECDSIRKLTPKECWRLMGQSDEDFEKARTALNNTYYNGKDRSSSQLYKQAGNSIVVDVLMAIFRKMM